MKLSRIMRNGVIGTSIALLLATSSVAATRPNVAVPVAGSAASSAAAADGFGGDASYGWLGLAVGVVLIALYAAFVVDDDDDDEDELSPG